MRRGTTPTHTFTTDVDLTGASVLYLTYKQNGRIKVEKTIDDVTINPESVQVTLTQKETLAFDDEGDVRIQIRARFPDGSAVASNIIKTTAQIILKEGEI